MSPAATPKSLLRRLSKAAFVTLGVLVILLAVALGVFRLLVGQIPEYQTELKAWVADELGLVVDFAALDARLGLTGPELSLRDASIGDGAAGGFLLAEQATITLDPVALVLERRIEISRLTLGGVRLTVERGADGTFRLGEHAIPWPGAGTRVLAQTVPQAVEVVIRDSALRYVDVGRGRTWDFENLEAVLESTGGALTARASLRPPAGLAREFALDVAAVSANAAGQAASWQLAAAAEDLDLAELANLLPFEPGPVLAGSGDVTAGLAWDDGALGAVNFAVDLDGLQVGAAGAGNAPFETLALNGEWRRARAGWRVELGGIELSRDGRDWDGSAGMHFELDRDAEGVRAVRLAGDFFRLEDLRPFVRAFPETQLAEQWALFEPRGDVRALDFSFGRQNERFAYELDAAFDGLAVDRVGSTPGITGLSGQVQASEDSGTVEFASGPLVLDWPALFPRTIDAESLSGAVVWRQGRDVVRILSIDLGVGVLGREARASFDLRLPQDGSPPTLDLEAGLAGVDLVPAKGYLPEPIMPGAVVDWLDRAIVGGRARDIELTFFGPLSGFPFDDGSGLFRVTADIEDATLDYMSGWPLAEALDGRIEFVNAGFAASGSGRTLANRAETVEIEIPDLRAPVLSLAAMTDGPLTGVLDYLRGAPLIAAHLGPDFERIAATGGSGAITAALDLPLMDLGAYSLDASLEIADGTLTIAGLGPAISEMNGVIAADEGTVSADGLDAVFVGGPVTVALGPSGRPGYRAELVFEGETTAQSVAESFGLPYRGLLDGQTLWTGSLLLPALDPLATTPTRVVIESNLAGVALRFPEPLAKPPGEPSNLRLDLEFAPDRRLEVAGNLGATRRFVLSFQGDDEGLGFTRGAVRFGGGEPTPPIQEGILVNGQLESLALDEWFALAGRTNLGRAGSRFLGADLEVADFHAYGQRLGATSLRVQRGAAAWEIVVDSEAIAGDIAVPRGSSAREPVVADMRRFYLVAGEGGDLAALDPRELPGLRLTAEAFGIGARRLGRVSATVEAVPRGLALTAFSSETAHYRAGLSGSWLEGPRGPQSTIEAELRSTDVQAALAELGLDPVISGETAEVAASVWWDGAPGGDWLDHLNGEVGLVVETGTLREVDPGAGRVLGLMSIAVLPRRLALDFRDVFEDGFAFDEISGDFRLIDGNAYTNNLKFGGPAAEIGVVGRTGLRDRDYRQQVVVSPEPGNMLPTVAGLIGGPGAGAATFVFTRLFKNQLKGIGQVAYCLEGDWEDPEVRPIENDQPELAERCADIPESMREPIADE